MGAPITIKKKKKLTVKSKTDADSTPTEEQAPEVILPGISQPQAEVAPKVNYTVYAILAAIVTAMFIGILIIQWIEWTYLQPAFPRPIPITGVQ